MRKTLVSCAAGAAAAALAVVAVSVPASASGDVTLTGAEEAPGPGDPDGRGEFDFDIKNSNETFCWELSWEMIGPPVAAHIHIAPAGEPGPVVIGLMDETGAVLEEGCMTVDEDLLREIKDDEEDFYVNVHTEAFPGGAIRAQLD